MAAEAVVQNLNVNSVDPQFADDNRRYIRARLVLNSRPYETDVAVHDMPFCTQPREKAVLWV